MDTIIWNGSSAGRLILLLVEFLQENIISLVNKDFPQTLSPRLMFRCFLQHGLNQISPPWTQACVAYNYEGKDHAIANSNWKKKKLSIRKTRIRRIISVFQARKCQLTEQRSNQPNGQTQTPVNGDWTGLRRYSRVLPWCSSLVTSRLCTDFHVHNRKGRKGGKKGTLDCACKTSVCKVVVSSQSAQQAA